MQQIFVAIFENSLDIGSIWLVEYFDLLNCCQFTPVFAQIIIGPNLFYLFSFSIFEYKNPYKIHILLH
jgi:hypothetical protein